MRITFRLIVSLVVAVAGVAALFARFQVIEERTRLETEMDRRALLLCESLQDNVESLLARGSSPALGRLVEKFSNRERVKGTAVYGADGSVLAVSKALSEPLKERPHGVKDLPTKPSGTFEMLAGVRMHVFGHPLGDPENNKGVILLVQEAAHIPAHLNNIWKRAFLRVLIQMALITLITLLVVRWSVQGPIARMADWMKRLRAGEDLSNLSVPKEDALSPIAREVSTFAQHLNRARTAAEEEARLRHQSEALWTPEKLKEVMKNRLQGKPLIVVSNREPYMHLHRGRKIECIIPAGGLVAALDPVLRATDGLWIAHGSGDADWDVVDDKNRIRVPPEDPHYTLKRVALTEEEENGYYFGFSNEGLWPLCHIAHARPIFRPSDWEQYTAVNAKFAANVLEEIEGMTEPLVLLQDYHFALLPRLIKDKRPDARIGLFWHIPWTNPEAFGICPWQKEILYGMLGADLIGFHTQFHANNFLDTVDRTLECRIEWERFTINKGGHSTLVKPFPISVDFPSETKKGAPVPGKEELLKELGVKAEFLAVGVDRVDYTKGILERFRAVERFLEKYPDYQGRFTLVQLGAPSRTHIKRYADFLAEVDQEADRINLKFKAKSWKAIVFLKRHHNPAEIRPFYKRADVCLVTSLHDGMNLVAKEFVVARDDSDGVLILSRFAGASRELRDALLINPYDVEQTADAIYTGLNLDPADRRERMRRMRENVRENNIYRWAGNLVLELAQVSTSQEGPRG
ncbi:MAG: trehalose-6-phosphate synthase [Elusimicrobia bacterium]|jgi:trehalose-6-phosphate synthase/HAMP domain-containing protein|nr:trehalose-6-phosphate synthase [Elusimicrobiota bacterium]